MPPSAHWLEQHHVFTLNPTPEQHEYRVQSLVTNVCHYFSKNQRWESFAEVPQGIDKPHDVDYSHDGWITALAASIPYQRGKFYLIPFERENLNACINIVAGFTNRSCGGVFPLNSVS
jgi:hypothetical protein